MKPVIYRIPGPWPGELSILARPRGNDWLSDEVLGWREAGINVVVSLLSDDEAEELGLEEEANHVRRSGLTFISFPIDDYDVPSSVEALQCLVTELEESLDRGQNIGIHCRAGVGRSALLAACLLASAGENVESCFQRISGSRGVAVPDTAAQRKWVGDFARIHHVS